MAVYGKPPESPIPGERTIVPDAQRQFAPLFQLADVEEWLALAMRARIDRDTSSTVRNRSPKTRLICGDEGERAGHHIMGRSIGHNLTTTKNDDTIRKFGDHVDVVCGQDDSGAIDGELPEDPTKSSLQIEVDTASRLIEQQNARSSDQNGGQCGEQSFATRKVQRIP